ncbi:MAG: glycosyltransferase, WecB/TagA/CpsF family protein [Myxococcaceae bacterium]|nr:glycosyltransferase, WecB/TagA/CpsF family protein [Myxococcaceae bacterium]
MYPRGVVPRDQACAALLSRLDVIRDSAGESALLDRLGKPSRPFVVSFLNQHGFNLAWSNPEFCQTLMDADVLLRDGVGISACLKLIGQEPGENMNGTDLIPRIAARYEDRRVMLIGTVEPWLERGASVLQERGCEVVARLDGFQSEAAYVDAVRAARPDLVILGMGMPKQERVAAELAKALDYPVLIVNGGAIIDFLGGRVERAPRWVQAARMEWGFRLVQEPRRMFGRYVVGGVTFLGRIAKLKSAQRG